MNKSKTMSKERDTYTLVIRPFLKTAGEWRTEVSHDPDPQYSFAYEWHPPVLNADGSQSGGRQAERMADAFEIRERFLEIKNAKDALELFEEFGPYQTEKERPPAMPSAAPIRLSQVLRRKSFYHHALFTRDVANAKPEYVGDDEIREFFESRYLWQNLSMELAFGQPMRGGVHCKDIESALRASVFLDRLRGLPWRLCAREDCGKAFELRSKRRTIFCTPECAHLSSVRSYNKRNATKEPAKTKNLTRSKNASL